jgi:hypothetical protein
MPYTINHYVGSQIVVVADGTVDQSTSLKLVGKNYAGYGEIQNENFVYLLENFASPSPGPSNPMPGQLWFDTANNKLNFYDVNKRWRTTGGSATSTTAPTGLVTGDFWFDTSNNQLYVWNSSPSPGKFILVGPEGVPGSGVTQMISASVVDTSSTSHTVIKAVVNDQVVFIVNQDSAFTLKSDVNTITGFSTIQQGITLAYTDNNAEPGQTTNNYRFWGTASNSDLLGGYSPTDYVLSAQPTFNAQVHFTNDGFTVGNPERLTVNIIGGTPTITNSLTDTINFNTYTTQQVTPLKLVGTTIQPGGNANDIGTISNPWRTVYATAFSGGPATQADTLKVGSNYVASSTSANANTIVARTNGTQVINGVSCTPGSVAATYFIGTATAALYADLAEKYLADAEYPVGTVIAVGGDAEVTAANFGDNPIGVVSASPAYLMNSELEGGTAIALKGRVPVLMTGPINKGEQVIAHDNGIASSISEGPNEAVFAISLESNYETGTRLVECVVL